MCLEIDRVLHDIDDVSLQYIITQFFFKTFEIILPSLSSTVQWKKEKHNKYILFTYLIFLIICCPCIQSIIKIQSW